MVRSHELLPVTAPQNGLKHFEPQLHATPQQARSTVEQLLGLLSKLHYVSEVAHCDIKGANLLGECLDALIITALSLIWRTNP